jgi:hypothetical protein
MRAYAHPTCSNRESSELIRVAWVLQHAPHEGPSHSSWPRSWGTSWEIIWGRWSGRGTGGRTRRRTRRWRCAGPRRVWAGRRRRKRVGRGRLATRGRREGMTRAAWACGEKDVARQYRADVERNKGRARASRVSRSPTTRSRPRPRGLFPSCLIRPISRALRGSLTRPDRPQPPQPSPAGCRQASPLPPSTGLLATPPIALRSLPALLPRCTVRFGLGTRIVLHARICSCLELSEVSEVPVKESAGEERGTGRWRRP